MPDIPVVTTEKRMGTVEMQYTHKKNLVHKIFSKTFAFFWCISHFWEGQARKK